MLILSKHHFITPGATTRPSMSSQTQSPAKCKQPSTGPQVKSSRTTRSQAAGQQEVTSCQPESPRKEKTKCKVCGKEFSLFLSHLKRSQACAVQYDVDAIEAEDQRRRKEERRTPEKRAASKTYYANHTPEKRAAMTEERRTPEKRATSRAAARRYYQKNKEQIAARRIIKFEQKTEKERFLEFHGEMKNTCSYGCICCHRILTNIANCKVKGGYEGLEGYLNERNPKLFKECILDKKQLPRGLLIENDIYLCNTCDRSLKQKQEMPDMCYNNGLGLSEIPDELKDLYDLEKTLLSKNIVFIKMYQMPTSRWKLTKDKAVNVPIDDMALQDTLNKVTKYPRLPHEAGVILVGLKRKLEYKNTHEKSLIRPQKLITAAMKLKEINQWYTDITIENRFSVLPDEQSSGEDSDSEEEEDTMDCIRRNQFNMGGETTMSNLFPEASAVTRLPQQSSSTENNQPGIAVAPGEGKIPLSLTQDENWVEKAFPCLFPDGKFGLHSQRKKDISAQRYFCQRHDNVDPRFRECPPFLFASLNHIEKKSLESAMGISYMRGKVVQGKLTNLEDACCVFDNQPGSPRYWQKRKSEVIAKLRQLGPFHIFFTLSCADRRWDENFVALLQQKGLKIEYEPVDQEEQDEDGKGTDGKWSYKKDNIFVIDEGRKKPLREFLEKEDLHDMVRKNVLTITKIFDKRVHKFMNKIVMAPSSPMKTKYYHYRVEFQKRGAGHIHGVLWLDIKKLESSSDGELSGLHTAMDKLRESKDRLSSKDEDVMAKFVDKFVSCSLQDEDLQETVQDVQKHSHKGSWEKKTGCYKKGRTCRFNFPRFPSEKTIIAQPLNSEDPDYEAKKKEYKDALQRVKEVLIRLSNEEQNTVDLEAILKEAKVTKNKYYEALKVSQTGACIILKRKPNEIYINNYNPEWIKAWDGNMDIAICFDYFAIITYITDYYTKTETELMKHLSAASKTCKERGDDFKAQMRYLVDTFLTTREMGEMESWYRIIPSLHLSESNLKCIFVATGFPENRSSFVRPVKDKLANQDNEEQEPQRGGVEIDGSDQTYKRVPPIHEKYENRPKSLDNICLTQFAMLYDHLTGQEAAKRTFVNGSSGMSEMTIKSWNPKHETPLRQYIKLGNNLGYMKLRSIESVIREHKVREDKNPHEYYYSKLLMYHPWRKEKDELYLEDAQKCLQLFLDKEYKDDRLTKIQRTQEKLLPHLNVVEEARAVVDLLDDQRPTHIGDMIDPQKEVENEEAAEEGLTEDPEHAARFPSESIVNVEDTSMPNAGGIYHRIPFPKDESELSKMRETCRSLDKDQRVVLDIMVKYVRQYRAAAPGHKPAPPLLKIHGGAGSGKTKLANTVAIVCDYLLRLQNKDMTDPDKPTVIKLAPTGKAANHIDGATLHCGINLPWGNDYKSLSDKTREAKRNVLSNLKILIIDEMSMVKADALYQIHMRLQEIKQNKKDFGGVSVLLFGDLMQLPPVMAAKIFSPPWNKKFQEYHKVNPLWELFDCIELTFNHRQGLDKEYGDMLNRIRKTEQTEDDLKVLASRICKEKPLDAWYVYGRNKACRDHNNQELAKLQKKPAVMSAVHISNTKPIIRDNIVGNTGFLDQLYLKEGARVMLIHNFDTTDHLSNGACGNVMGFEWSRGEHQEVKKVLVQFDDPRAGAKLRNKEKSSLRYPGMPQVNIM